MNYTEAEQAIIAAVAGIVGAPPIAYPDAAQPPALPRWVVQTATNSGRPVTYDGLTSGQTEILVRVETQDGDYARENTKYLSLLLDAFPAQRRLATYSGAEVLITQAPEPRPPIVGGGVYSRPVYIRGAFHL